MLMETEKRRKIKYPGKSPSSEKGLDNNKKQLPQIIKHDEGGNFAFSDEEGCSDATPRKVL